MKFNSQLEFGARGEEVRQLQQFLNTYDNGKYAVASSGAGSAGNETDYFGNLTQSALQRFQSDQGIVNSGDPSTTGFGRFGPKTMGAINNLSAQSTRDFVGDDEFNVDNPGTIGVDDLENGDSIEDLTSRISRLSGEASLLAEPSERELELSNKIVKEDLENKQDRRDLYGQGTGIPLALLQGKERRIAENRAFDRSFDQLELDLLESSRLRNQRVAQGELDQATAESEAIQETIEKNTDLLDRLIKINSGATLEEIAAESPETFERIKLAAANSNYSIGDVRQGLQNQVDGAKKSLQFKNVNGQVVGVNPMTGEIVTTLGRAGTGSGGSGGGSASGGSGDLKTILNLVPNMSNENAQALGKMLVADGAEEQLIKTIAQKYPKAFANNRVNKADVNQLKQDMESDIKSTLRGAVGSFFAGGKATEDTQAELNYWGDVIRGGIVSYDEGKEVEYITSGDRETLETLFNDLQDVLK